jgi:4-alpha-glucanotransferase
MDGPAMIEQRASGILLHVSSLPSEFGIGDLGPEAYEWIDFLSEAGQRYWQVLPLNPTSAEGFNSPYQALSAFAGNPLLLSPALLRDQGLLTDSEVSSIPSLENETVSYDRVSSIKCGLLNSACARFLAEGPVEEFDRFCADNQSWLDDFALFAAVRKRFPGSELWDWPGGLRDRDPDALAKARRQERGEIDKQKALQFLFVQQWLRLKRYANEKGVRIFGDLPFYTGRGSADIWANPGLFKLDESKRPKCVAGVPPDAFSDTGQLWGVPVYDWGRQADDGFKWWVERLSKNFEMFDLLRIDHFRGFAASWEVPVGHRDARKGKWSDGPRERLFDCIVKKWPCPPIVAEDLGFITQDVMELLQGCDFPGMKVLLFAFDNDSSNPHLPHNHVRNCVVYTGTHDNNTVRGWFETEAGPEKKRRLADYLGAMPTEKNVGKKLVQMSMASVAALAVLPMQDVLGLGAGARMNRPSIEEGNWEWRLERGQITGDVAGRLLRLARTYGRE